MDSKKAYQELLSLERTVGLWTSVDAVLGWDESTYLPEAAVGLRGEQKALLASTVHDLVTNPRIGDLLTIVQDSPLATDEEVAANLREFRRAHDRATKLPPSLVHRIALASTRGREAWIEARRRSDYSLFQPHLESLLKLRHEECSALGFCENPYDAMLDHYEPGTRTQGIAGILDALKRELVPLIDRVRGSSQKSSLEALKAHYPVESQYEFGKATVVALGFDLKRGRIDTTTHPFCSGFGPMDVRITTRYDTTFFPSSFYSLLHEAGHGLYEQGLKEEKFGQPMGAACSTAIHESQSRMWENLVGRRHSFWQHFYPKAQKVFSPLQSISGDEFVRAMNHVELSPIRVEADEMTYNLHIILRFELERAMLDGDLHTRDLPGAWNEKCKQIFGFTPPSDALGCLQDVHWSGGDFGYFPTYALGNMYAAQFFEAAERELGNLDAQFSQGQFGQLREWLRRKIHCQGQRYIASELCQKVTGLELSHEALIRHLTKKCDTFYG